jgi:DNA integrity scanning protein DisA with diadenylate cyclase activity
MHSTSNGYMDEYNRLLFKQICRKNIWLIDLAKRHKIQPILLHNIVESSSEIVNLRKENERLNVGLILGNDDVKLEQSPIQVNSFHIRKKTNFANLGNSISGNHLSYLVNNDGIVTIGKISSKLIQNNATTTLREVSKVYHTMTFCIRNSVIEIYSCGDLVRIYKQGVWTKPCRLTSHLTDLDKKGFPLDILVYVFKLCKQLSEKEKGGIFVITKADHLSHCSSLVGNASFKKSNVFQLPKSQILEFACLDGAVVISTQSELIGFGQNLEPPPTVKYDKEAGRGTRHNSAAKYSSAVDSVVFVVSKDGPISLYFRGKVLARCFEEIFGI